MMLPYGNDIALQMMRLRRMMFPLCGNNVCSANISLRPIGATSFLQ
jgi:hypothetical protein